jgi:hypothetical protein
VFALPSAIKWTADAAGAAIENVGVDHDGAYVVVSEQLLDGADVLAVFQHVRGKGIP